jgi:hypothetical protein
MMTRFVFPMVVLLLGALPAVAQHPGEGGHEQMQHGPETHSASTPRANGGHVPAAPDRRDMHAKPEPERRPNGKVNQTQHVNNDHWYGHDRPDDKRFHIEHPFEHGRFEHFGVSYRYNVLRIDRDQRRFWLPGGFFFEVAAWDWATCADWCWDCGDDFTIYEDPDHIGWYMLYNVHTGHYVHVMYMGA